MLTAWTKMKPVVWMVQTVLTDPESFVITYMSAKCE